MASLQYHPKGPGETPDQRHACVVCRFFLHLPGMGLRDADRVRHLMQRFVPGHVEGRWFTIHKSALAGIFFAKYLLFQGVSPIRGFRIIEKLLLFPSTFLFGGKNAMTQAMAIEHLPLTRLRPWQRNARTHSKKQIRQIADSIETFGFTNPVLIDAENTILAGHGRVAAAKLLGMERVPCVRLEHMTPAQKRAYVLADNKLALNAGWDEQILAEELGALMALDLDFQVEVTGFSIPEIDGL